MILLTSEAIKYSEEFKEIDRVNQIPIPKSSNCRRRNSAIHYNSDVLQRSYIQKGNLRIYRDVCYNSNQYRM